MLLVNGLDEGIFVAVVAVARDAVAGASTTRPEVIVPLPAFDMYGISARRLAGCLVEVMPEPGFSLPVSGLLAAITPRTRLVFITSPNNPTGVRVSLADIERVASALPPDALLFVDEAYHDFCGDTALPLIASRRNVIVGRTFAKAHGLAALRAGCLIAIPTRSHGSGPSCRPTASTSALPLDCGPRSADRARLAWYVGQVERSRDAHLRLVRPAGVDVLDERRELRAAAGWRARGGRGGEAGRTRHLHSQSQRRTGVRGMRAHHRRRRGAHSAVRRRHGGDPVRRAVIDRQTTETQIRLALTIEGRGPL